MSVQTTKNHKPNPYQEAIVDFFSNGSGHAVIEAVAGSGKTTTLLKLFDLVPAGKTVAYGVFNKANAEEAKEKVGFRPGIYIKTAHGFGCNAWKRVHPHCEIDADKKWDMIVEKLELKALNEEGRLVYKNPQQAEVIRKLIGFAKDSLFGKLVKADNLENWDNLVKQFNLASDFEVNGSLPINISDILLDSCRKAFAGLKYSIKIAYKIIDYSDMIYMPVINQVQMWQYDYVFIDEAQDTNAARRELFKAMLKPNGRMIAVGDRHQAIYGFTGADAKALDIIREEMKATSLPLTVSFRCPKAVVRMAQKYVSHIEAHEDAPEGHTDVIKVEKLLKMDLNAEDFIVCRNTSPLVELAYHLIRNNIPCHIQGRDIGENLIKMLKQWSSARTIGIFLEKLDIYTDKQVAKFVDAGQDEKAVILEDKRDTFHAICEFMNKKETLAALEQKINALFMDGDEARKTLKLLTIHKSKGLEADRVFWYGPSIYQPSPFAVQEWSLEAEVNLCYVAVTRARRELIEVIVPPKKRGN